MKHVFSANTTADEGSLHLLQALLEEDGIECFIRNESLSVGKGDIPCTECVPELWVDDDRDYPTARQIVDNWIASRTTFHVPWTCPRCKESIEGQFTSCWKCGYELP